MEPDDKFKISFYRLQSDIRSYLIGAKLTMIMMLLIILSLQFVLIYFQNLSKTIKMQFYGHTVDYSDIYLVIVLVGILVCAKLSSFLMEKYLTRFGLKDLGSLSCTDENKIAINEDCEEVKKINSIEKALLYSFLFTVFLVLIYLFIRGWNYNYIFYLVIGVFGMIYCAFLAFVIIGDKQRLLKKYVLPESNFSETNNKEK